MRANLKADHAEQVAGPEKSIERCHASAKASRYGYAGINGGGGLSSSIDMHCATIQKLDTKLAEALAWLDRIEAYADLIDAGLMTVAEALRTMEPELHNRGRLAAAALIARPHEERLVRDRVRGINNENEAIAFEEALHGASPGTYGRRIDHRDDKVRTFDDADDRVLAFRGRL